ncbi:MULTISPECIES: fimbrial protein [unclassified Pseudomonas]|uniref:fimbrial protein n=1 Tax=unclassified Pseudomonas TaxID=196821 RepID=UPI00224ACC4B|nr:MULTISPECIES: fimbrial protein [unclassified Pseudomonas]MCX2891029.1 fimbrial protein [Pseudomonas sp. DCB_BI]MDH4550312.1 type 1 fimbrial protein [Pseudomonas sp. BN607]
MNASFIRRAILPLALTALLASSNALALCRWDGGLPSGQLLYNIQLGNLWVPRDAPVGSVIRTASRMSTPNDTGHKLLCPVAVAGDRADVNLPNTASIFPGPLPPISGVETDRVLETNIPGVGIHVRLGAPYEGGWDNYWIPRTPVSVPYSGYQDRPSGLAITTTYLDTYITVIKTGEIPPGPHSFAGQELFTGNFTGVGSVLKANLHGTVTQAQCSLGANPVSADPVDLKHHELSSFSGEGSTTPAIPFHINLNQCADDSGMARVHIQLDVTKGATVIDADKGLFSLIPEVGNASGLGVQILRADGVTPAKLGEELDVSAITPGDMRIDFNARYYQVAPQVTSGPAKSALNFTIYYK